MLLMLKLLATTLLLSSLLQAATSSKDVENFLKKSYEANPNILKLKIKVKQTIVLEKVKGWNAYIVNINATVKGEKGNRDIKQSMVWFSNGDTISPDLIDMKTGISFKESLSPSFEAKYYKKENLIYGNANAKHRVAIFSDPLCPFCRNYVPEAINAMKKSPEKFAIYYYHFPLPTLHPAGVELVRAAVAAELKGKKDVVLKLYTVKVDAKERDVKKILAAFNKTMNTNITPADLTSKAVNEHIKNDMDIATALMVSGTPTVFFDDKLDKTKRKYEKAQ
ncbi:thioredoxin domain-containing protein [Sulfurimonas sp.]|uniref:DsbA family protein n=1 Tax=Sulfurimonas sp. TaxID=2022749 RepID=UPI0025F7006C|nr:thioredoxin domain-containing protein [Sulfurimonas sp.]